MGKVSYLWKKCGNKAGFIMGILFFSVFFAAPVIVSAGYYDYTDTVLVINDNSATSTTVGNYFIASRSFPLANVIHITTQTTETVSYAEFTDNIRTPIENFLTSNDMVSSTNYIILTKDVPLKVSDSGVTGGSKSVDSQLALILGSYASWINNGASSTASINNPYYNATTSFSREVYDIYLVTRLDGYTITQVEALIDRSANATTTKNGQFILDVDANRDNTSYEYWNDYLRDATTSLATRGFSYLLDETTTYLTGKTNVLGYASWGSNDCCDTNNGIPGNTYVNGAIAETAVSSSGRTFTYPPTYGQSLIADLIAEGVSAVKGYVSEPFLGSVANPNTLFDRYTAGYNAADSFYMASHYLNWKDVVVGDPKMVAVKDILLPFDLTSPIHNGIVASQSPLFSWDAPDAYAGIAKYQLFVDGVLNTDNVSGTSTVPDTSLSAGTHTWYVRAIDNDGNMATSTSTFTLNVVPGYATGYTFYVDNVLGDDDNPGTQILPWATIGKAATALVAGDSVIIVKNINAPYRENILPSQSGTSESVITFRGSDVNTKPEIWGSEDISTGWSAYSDGNPDTYKYSTSTSPLVLATGSSLANLTKRPKGATINTLAPGEWKWSSASSTIYYRLAVGESIDTLHVEAAVRNNILGDESKTNITYQDLIVRYSKGYGANLTGGSMLNRVEVYDSYFGATISGTNPAVHNSIIAGSANYGIYLNLPVGVQIYNSVIYDNTTAGVYVLLNAQNSIIKNNIFSNNGQAFSFAVWNPISNFSASNNSWLEDGDAKWNTYKGTNNKENIDSMFTSPSTRNFRLQSTSPNIDSGTSISGLTTDILGNPIYGTPDIGPYEYQPPYTISIDKIPLTGTMRLYKDGKYRTTTATSSAAMANMTITPEGGFPSGDYSEYLNVAINSWNTSGDYSKSWTESSSSAGGTAHTIGDLAPNAFYEVKVDGTRHAQFRTDASGQGTFTYTGGYSTHTFSIAPDLSIGGGPVVGSSFGLITSTVPSTETKQNEPTATTTQATSTQSTIMGTTTPTVTPPFTPQEQLIELQTKLVALLKELVDLLTERLQNITKTLYQ